MLESSTISRADSHSALQVLAPAGEAGSGGGDSSTPDDRDERNGAVPVTCFAPTGRLWVTHMHSLHLDDAFWGFKFALPLTRPRALPHNPDPLPTRLPLPLVSLVDALNGETCEKLLKYLDGVGTARCPGQAC